MNQDRCSKWLDAIYETLATGGQPNAELGEHLQNCASCNTEWEETQSLRERLQCDLRQPTSDDRFTAAVWRTIEAAERKPAARPLLSWRFGLPTLAAAAAVCAIVLVVNRTPDDTLTALGSGAHRPIGSNAQIAKRDKTIVDVPDIGSTAAAKKSLTTKSVAPSMNKPVRSPKNAPKNSSESIHPRRPAFRTNNRTMVATSKSGAANQAITKVTTKELASTWQAWGEYYAGQGYSQYAAAAYEQQYSITGDPTAAYNAGCAAETAGDFSTALKSYIQCLQPTTQKDARPNEGANHWTRDLDV